MGQIEGVFRGNNEIKTSVILTLLHRGHRGSLHKDLGTRCVNQSVTLAWLDWGEFVAEKTSVTFLRQSGLWEWCFYFSNTWLLFLSYGRHEEKDEKCRRGWITVENFLGGQVGNCQSRDDALREGAREQLRYCSSNGVQGFWSSWSDTVTSAGGLWVVPATLAQEISSCSKIPEPKTGRQEEVTSSWENAHKHK